MSKIPNYPFNDGQGGWNVSYNTTRMRMKDIGHNQIDGCGRPQFGFWILFRCWPVSRSESLGLQKSPDVFRSPEVSGCISVNKTEQSRRVRLAGGQPTPLLSPQILSLALSPLLLSLLPTFSLCFLLLILFYIVFPPLPSWRSSLLTSLFALGQLQTTTGEKERWCSTIRSSFGGQGPFPLLQQLFKGCQSPFAPEHFDWLVTRYGPLVVNPVRHDVTGQPKGPESVVRQ